MPLHPILVLDQVLREYGDHLRTEFRARDPRLKEALEQELDRPRFLAQEPFFQAHRPFRLGKRWVDLPLDPKLARVMGERARSFGSPVPDRAFHHQSAAIEELLAPGVHPVVVTTGTGSGKTEAFLLPVLQNAIEDATRFRSNGLTAILVYPMNALANDQAERIDALLDRAGFGGTVAVAKYDRGTSNAERARLRENPPHVLLTNYMMLEYLLVRPADRDSIFANHRCRFLVLDEVHSYRGTLGTNIALLVRRLREHLATARQDWNATPDDVERPRRFPKLVPIGTSATIKSVDSSDASRDTDRADAIRRRDEAVQRFFGDLTGADPGSIRVFGEEVASIERPAEARYAPTPPQPVHVDPRDLESVRRTLCALAGIAADAPLDAAVRGCGLLWDLHEWLIHAPLSIEQIVERVIATVPERRDCRVEDVRGEVEAALVAGAALPEDGPGTLRLRGHRFLRGGWKFHRCVDPACGRLFPMGEERCRTCGTATAPLFLCRNCGADALRVTGDPDAEPLRPSSAADTKTEWMLYEPGRFAAVRDGIDRIDGQDDNGIEGEEIEVDDEGDDATAGARGGGAGARAPRGAAARRGANRPRQMRGREVREGSFDPGTLLFSGDVGDYPVHVLLAPARTQCLCCGGTAGSRNVLTPVALGTSAAVKVVAEGLTEALERAHAGEPGRDGKERLLVFSDSRQDAAHQARFILFASRYDRMRRNLYKILREHGSVTLQRAVELLAAEGSTQHDNPHDRPEVRNLPEEARKRMRAWEEVPLLDDIATSAGYRGSIVRLGLVGVSYEGLREGIGESGGALAAAFGVDLDALAHVCRCMLDDMRSRAALSRELLRYHILHPSCPEYLRAADWERRIKRPSGYAADGDGRALASMDPAEVPYGITLTNAWRRGGRGRAPSLERILRHLLGRFGGADPTEDRMEELLELLRQDSYLVAVDLFGSRDRRRLLQLNDEVLHLDLLDDATRRRCDVCGFPWPGAAVGHPCGRCHGSIVPWAEAAIAGGRSVQRIRSARAIPLVAGEHTAQVPNAKRLDLEASFKAAPGVSKLNLLACSPTLEMGIDVGGLDAVILRNIPPRPDNYAQRGGRAGRRARIGIVVGYARSVPHDQYFYDNPAEMIAGEVPAPSLALANRDVILRHLHAIAFGAADPGLAGRMVEYISPTGELVEDKIAELIDAVRGRSGHAVTMVRRAFGEELLAAAGLDGDALAQEMDGLPAKIRDVFQRTARQVQELRRPLDQFWQSLTGIRYGNRSGELARRLLGIRDAQDREGESADDRSAGYPLRRFAEFGILPGYEFPMEPASLRLLGDDREEDLVTVDRRFGIAQFQPDAQVFARTRKWKVIGLDGASPWNPRGDALGWPYRVCSECGLRHRADHPLCPRCSSEKPAPTLPAATLGGFIARRDESPVLDEEDRFAQRNLVRIYPQWDGQVIGRWTAGAGWGLRLSTREEVQWLNEGIEPSALDLQRNRLRLHDGAKGFLLCADCGRLLEDADDAPNQGARGGRRAAHGDAHQGPDRYGHRDDCPRRGVRPAPLALAASRNAEILRLLVPVPEDLEGAGVMQWGLSLGYSLRTGMRRLYMLDGPEVEFEFEGPWRAKATDRSWHQASLTFVDPSLGGTGYLRRAAEEMQAVAGQALVHLDHAGCDTACYRCLKSYQNQRHHPHLRWPLVIPFLEDLATIAVEPRRLEAGDLDDPGPWLDAYAAGVGSPLELRFLRLFESCGFHPERQVAIAVEEGKAPITVADFAVLERRLAIYIDGAAFHVGARLRRDRAIRERLRSGQPAWTVTELRARDLGEGKGLVERLRG